ncbi:hypothetical protein SSCG_03578 [Streptomyces clavuligerus]|nr:hypothetical protein SSCG_03578 [Streptomyces clavuligerus]
MGSPGLSGLPSAHQRERAGSSDPGMRWRLGVRCREAPAQEPAPRSGSPSGSTVWAGDQGEWVSRWPRKEHDAHVPHHARRAARPTARRRRPALDPQRRPRRGRRGGPRPDRLHPHQSERPGLRPRGRLSADDGVRPDAPRPAAGPAAHPGRRPDHRARRPSELAGGSGLQRRHDRRPLLPRTRPGARPLRTGGPGVRGAAAGRAGALVPELPHEAGGELRGRAVRGRRRARDEPLAAGGRGVPWVAC